MMRLLTAAVCVAVLALTGCGDDGGGGSTGGQAGATKDAKAIDPGAMKTAKGQVVYCTGKDTTGETKAWSKQFNEKYASQGLTATSSAPT